MTPTLRTLCGRLAAERTRPATWAESARLRADVLQRLQAGADAATIEAELRAALRAAEADQRAGARRARD